MQNVQGFLDLPIRKIYEAKLFKSYLFLCIHDTYNLNKKFFQKNTAKSAGKNLFIEVINTKNVSIKVFLVVTPELNLLSCVAWNEKRSRAGRIQQVNSYACGANTNILLT